STSAGRGGVLFVGFAVGEPIQTFAAVQTKVSVPFGSARSKTSHLGHLEVFDHGQHARIIAIDYGHTCHAQESCLGRGIRLHGSVPVKVVLTQVQHDCCIRLET